MLHNIVSIVNEGKNRELYNLASEINKYHSDNTKMYQVVKCINRKPLQNLMVCGKDIRNVTGPNAIYNINRNHLKAHFNDPKESKLEPFISNPIPLDNRITKVVAKSIHKLRNNIILHIIKYNLNS